MQGGGRGGGGGRWGSGRGHRVLAFEGPVGASDRHCRFRCQWVPTSVFWVWKQAGPREARSSGHFKERAALCKIRLVTWREADPRRRRRPDPTRAGGYRCTALT